MSRHVIRSKCLGPWQRPHRGKKWPVATTNESQHSFTRRSTRASDSKASSTPRVRSRYEVFNRIPMPERTPAAWTALLERGLPHHLLQSGELKTDTTLEARDIAEILLAAQRGTDPRNGVDLLFYLGMEKGRWKAVIWLIKYLVESFGTTHLQRGRLSHTVSSWNSDKFLDKITNDAIDFQHLVGPTHQVISSSYRPQSLDELTDDLKPEKLSRNELLPCDALGQIWRSLGHMTIACADTDIKPEILEIIAYLHHMEIMPSSIYSQKPSGDVTTIQQPPTLSLFSSRILTSLSDAAWRAHQKLVIEEAKMKGGEYASVRPEIPGMAYRVNVAGIRPEIWLELILWSCLHGGWVLEGAEILRKVYLEPTARQWKPLSWRSLIPDDEADDPDWDNLGYLFNTRAPSTMDQSKLTSPVAVEKTLSCEVVNAYVDALLSKMRVGVGDRGVPPALVLEFLHAFQKFLARSGLNLGSGSWDAVILRYFEAQETIVSWRPRFENLISLSPAMAEEASSPTRQNLPAYVLDGSAAIIGLFHRALRSRVKAGDVGGALELFKSLQSRTDKDKRKSVVDFLRKQQLLLSDGDPESGLFTSNFSGIDYPAFDVQIPPTTIGPFLELITDAKAYEFGKWLLYSEEVDGPLIPERLYGDTAITPGLVKFATETNDKVLLSKVINARALRAGEGEASLPRNVLQSFFESQVKLKRWDTAVRLLQHMKDTPFSYWNAISLAHVARMMLLQFRGSEDGDERSQRDLIRARDLFTDMVQGRYERPGHMSGHVQEHVNVMLTMLSTLGSDWARHCSECKALDGNFTFTLPVKAFNLILEGTVEAFGSKGGRRLLGIFWSHPVRNARKARGWRSGHEPGEPVMTRYEPSVLDAVERKRTVVRIPDLLGKQVIVYGGLKPDLMTFRIVFQKAIQEWKHWSRTDHLQADGAHTTSKTQSDLADCEAQESADMDAETVDLSPAGIVVWTVRSVRSLGMADEDIRGELKRTLSEHEMPDIRKQLSDLFGQANHEGSDSDSINDDNLTPIVN